MFAELAEIIPSAEHWPRFTTNHCYSFEARLSMLQLLGSTSLFFACLAGARLLITVPHGQGFTNFSQGGNILVKSQTRAL